MEIDTIYRYPVKGLTAEPLDQATLLPGRAIAWDRAFALAQGDCGFDDLAPAWRPKTEFLCLARNPEAALIDARFSEKTELLTLLAPDDTAIDASPFTEEGRQSLAAFVEAVLPHATRGRTRFVHAPDHSFCDHKTQVISLIGLPSLAGLEAAAGAPRHKLRFRANLYLTGLDPWEEFSWLGKTIEIGGAKLGITDRIDRCAATCVNPEQKRRDANPIKELARNFGHVDCGVYAEVLTAGTVCPGDRVRVCC